MHTLGGTLRLRACIPWPFSVRAATLQKHYLRLHKPRAGPTGSAHLLRVGRFLTSLQVLLIPGALKTLSVIGRDVGVAARDQALIWLLDQSRDRPEGAIAASPTPVANARATLSGLEDGPSAIEWTDTLTGKVVTVQKTKVKLALELEGWRGDSGEEAVMETIVVGTAAVLRAGVQAEVDTCGHAALA
jgi:hypothetical protein